MSDDFEVLRVWFDPRSEEFAALNRIEDKLDETEAELAQMHEELAKSEARLREAEARNAKLQRTLVRRAGIDRQLNEYNQRVKAERDRLREFFEASVACEADDANDETFERLYRARAALAEGQH